MCTIKKIGHCLVLASLYILSGCAHISTENKGEIPMKKITITSTAFRHGDEIPALYSCDGENQSPPLQWKDIPAETKSITLIVDDPDAPKGTWVHWLVFNLPPDLYELPTHTSVAQYGAIEGKNSWGKSNYGGPCPPPADPAHRYFFKLYALDKKLDLNASATKEELLNAMQNHIIGQGELMGLYKRKTSNL